jgi:hypothetical protein
MRKRGMSSRGAMQLSFGMIFSIILIIAFIAFAFYAIRMFLGIQEKAKVANFKENLQNDVDSLWKGSYGSQEVSYNLPSEIKEVCFKNWRYENIIFKPEDELDFAPINIEHLNIAEIASAGEEYCLEISKGKVEMVLKKGFGETLVVIERN